MVEWGNVCTGLRPVALHSPRLGSGGAVRSRGVVGVCLPRTISEMWSSRRVRHASEKAVRKGGRGGDLWILLLLRASNGAERSDGHDAEMKRIEGGASTKPSRAKGPKVLLDPRYGTPAVHWSEFPKLSLKSEFDSNRAIEGRRNDGKLYPPLPCYPYCPCLRWIFVVLRAQSVWTHALALLGCRSQIGHRRRMR